MTQLFIIFVFAMFIYSSMWFIYSLLVRRNDIADTAWGLGFIYLVFVTVIIKPDSLERDSFWVIAFCTILWALRLTLHIHKRNEKRIEDYRYREWRDSWGKWFYIRSYFQVFLLQGFLTVLISTSLLVSALGSTLLSVTSVVGIVVWIFGFLFESIADAQLSKFTSKVENRGKLMTEGLWAYSRHPNYFGEVLQWWGIWVITISEGIYLLSLISPVTITLLILYVSGIPLLENRYKGNAEYEIYKNKVSKFIPWFPKKTS